MRDAIKEVLDEYDAKKSLWRRIFSDQSDIIALRELYRQAQTRPEDNNDSLHTALFFLIIQRQTAERSLSEKLLKRLLNRLQIDNIIQNLDLHPDETPSSQRLSKDEVLALMKTVHALKGSALLKNNEQSLITMQYLAHNIQYAEQLRQALSHLKVSVFSKIVAYFITPKRPLNKAQSKFLTQSLCILANSSALNWWNRNASIQVLNEMGTRENAGFLKIIAAYQDCAPITLEVLRRFSKNPDSLNLKIAPLLQAMKGSPLAKGAVLNASIGILESHLNEVGSIEAITLEFAKGHIRSKSDLQKLLNITKSGAFKDLRQAAFNLDLSLNDFLNSIRDHEQSMLFWNSQALLEKWSEFASPLLPLMQSDEEKREFFMQFTRYCIAFQHDGASYCFRQLKPIYLKRFFSQVFALCQESNISKAQSQNAFNDLFGLIYKEQQAAAKTQEHNERNSRENGSLTQEICKKFGITKEVLESHDADALQKAQKIVKKHYQVMCSKHHPDKVIRLLNSKPDMNEEKSKQAVARATKLFQLSTEHYEKLTGRITERLNALKPPVLTSLATPFADAHHCAVPAHNHEPTI